MPTSRHNGNLSQHKWVSVIYLSLDAHILYAFVVQKHTEAEEEVEVGLLEQKAKHICDGQANKLGINGCSMWGEGALKPT